MITLRIVRNAAVVWLTSRVAIAMVPIIKLSPAATLVFLSLVLVLIWLDMMRTWERLLFANLSVSPVRLTAIALVVVSVLELGFATALATWLPGAPIGPSP